MPLKTMDEFNPFAPPEEMPDTAESRPWLVPVRLERHPPLRKRPWRDWFRFARWKPSLQILGVCFGPLFAIAVVCGLLALIYRPFGGGVCLAFGLSWISMIVASAYEQRCTLLDKMYFIEPLFPDGGEESENIPVQLIAWHRNWFFKLLGSNLIPHADNGLLRFEPEGLRFRGNVIDLFIPRSAVETCAINDALTVRIVLRESCSPDWSVVFFTVIPHRLKWYSRGWGKTSLAFLERIKAFF